MKSLNTSRLLLAALGLLLATASALLTLALGIRLTLATEPPPPRPPPPPLAPATTNHLLLVLVDGLREDVAHDRVQMPHLAERLATHAHGTLWAGPISMTSSAVLSFGTGARGDLEQVANNESHGKSAFDDWIGHVKNHGGTTVWVGDDVWRALYPTSFTAGFPSKGGLSIDAEEDREVFDSAKGVFHTEPRPTFVVTHFLTPDHVGHGHGIGPYYAKYIHGFDERLEALLSEVPTDTTVFVLSDHGATDGGTHGSNTEIQRRSPLVAYGPGVVQGPVALGSVDQIDLPATFATLLGVEAPAHDRGLIATQILAIDTGTRTQLACTRLADLTAFARDALGEKAVADFAAESHASCTESDARKTGAALDEAFGKRSGALGWIAALIAAVFPGAFALLAYRKKLGNRHFFSALLAAALLVVAATTAAYGLELLPGRAPDRVRGLLYALGNLPLLALLLRPRWLLGSGLGPSERSRTETQGLLERLGPLAAIVVPGALLVTETKTTQPECFALVAVVAIVLTYSFFQRNSFSNLHRIWRATSVVLPVLLLAPLGVLNDNFLPAAWVEPRERGRVVAAIAFASYPLLRKLSAQTEAETNARFAPFALGLFPAAALFLRDFSPPALVAAAFYLATGVALFAAFATPRTNFSGARTIAAVGALSAYALVSRPAEVPFVILTLLAAETLGAALFPRATAGRIVLGSDEVGTGQISGYTQLTLATALLFALPWLQRIAIQEGIHFTHFDFGAGAFRQNDVPFARLIFANIVKHGAPRALLLALFVATVAREKRLTLFRGLLLAESARAAFLVLLLYVCRHSFWTPVWVLGDLPHALVGMVLAAGALGLTRCREERTASEPSEIAKHFDNAVEDAP